MRPFVVCAAIAFSLAACSSSTGIDLGQQNALRQHESQWNQRNIHSYSFVYDFQQLAWRATVVVTVRNDVVVSVVDASTGEAADPNFTYPTIDGVFDIAKGGLAASNMIVDVQYDSQYGFPAHLSLEARVANPGGGYGSSISSFQPLE